MRLHFGKQGLGGNTQGFVCSCFSLVQSDEIR